MGGHDGWLAWWSWLWLALAWLCWRLVLALALALMALALARASWTGIYVAAAALPWPGCSHPWTLGGAVHACRTEAACLPRLMGGGGGAWRWLWRGHWLVGRLALALARAYVALGENPLAEGGQDSFACRAEALSSACRAEAAVAQGQSGREGWAWREGEARWRKIVAAAAGKFPCRLRRRGGSSGGHAGRACLSPPTETMVAQPMGLPMMPCPTAPPRRKKGGAG
eukprot:CAMPEP_0183707462 /NCGR_PEP_ID=MMETSP0737-20130205/4030_1 /TAXON_ID=385413 /ORGANISM="Thalassiosira miniscula, Strain CCMP1093" /LENGTH=225 /DNA_ID=CAMNT_0025935129 /DNA_START=385 /DNA_END=1065 /DNA_ORIENTATION=+